MNNTLIYIGDDLLDLFPGTIVAITFKAFEIGDITTRNSSYTNKIKAPRTENNIRIIDHADNIKSSSGSTYKRLSCRVVQNGIEIPEMNSMLIDGVDDTINFSIYTSESGALSQLDDLCSDLDFGINEVLDDAFLDSYRDGSQPVVTSGLDWGNYIAPVIIDLKSPNIQGAWSNVLRSNVKESCRAATTANITLSGLQTVDVVLLIVGDRCLVKNQTTTSQNGIYIVGTGAWTRSSDFNSASSTNDAFVFVESGTVNSGLVFIQTLIVNNFGSDNISFVGGLTVNTTIVGLNFKLNDWVNVINSVPTYGKIALGGSSPMSKYFEQEFEFFPVSNHSPNNAYRIQVDWRLDSQAYVHDQLNNSGGNVQLKFSAQDMTSLFSVSDSIYLITENNFYNTSGTVTAVSFTGTETLVTTDIPFSSIDDFGTLTNLTTSNPDVRLRAYLIDDDNNMLLALDVNETTSDYHLSSSGFTVQPEHKYTKIAVIAFKENDDPATKVRLFGVFVDLSWENRISANFYLPQIKYHSTIEKILERLGPYSLEYPADLTDFYEHLLITYSRDYYGYRDASTPLTELSVVNMSRFILPDISQRALLKDWLIRTFSLFRIKNGVIEVRPMYNIIRYKEKDAVDWTNKRDTSMRDGVKFTSSNYGQKNWFEDGDTRDEFLERIKKGVAILPASENKYSFDILNTALKSESTIYISIFDATQHAIRNGSTETARIPIWDITSADRFDFLKSPTLRILFAEVVAGISVNYAGTIRSDAWYSAYKDDEQHNAWSHWASWDHFIDLGYSNFVESLQKMKIAERHYFLDTTDIAGLDLFKPVFDDGAYFLINKVHNYVPGKTVKVELFKI